MFSLPSRGNASWDAATVFFIACFGAFSQRNRFLPLGGADGVTERSLDFHLCRIALEVTENRSKWAN
jgi:hypothetical protein